MCYDKASRALLKEQSQELSAPEVNYQVYSVISVFPSVQED